MEELIWYAEQLYDMKVKVSYSEDRSILFLHNHFDDFKIYLNDKERFNYYTIAHKNKKENQGHWHTQMKCRDLNYGIYMCLVHGFNKCYGLWSNNEDFYRFYTDAMRAYRYE